jgi:hypothetical protein
MNLYGTVLALLLLLQSSIFPGRGTGGVAQGASSATCSTASAQGIYDADSVTSSPMTANWTDGTANHFDMVPTASPTWAASQVNGHAAVTTNGSSQFFACFATCNSGAGIVFTSNVTVYVVAKLASLTDSSGFTSGEFSGNSFEAYDNMTTGMQGANQQNTAVLGTGTTSIATGVWHLQTFTYNPSTGVGAFYIDGVEDGSYTGGPNITAGIDNLLSNNGGAQFFNGSVSLIVITTAAYDPTFNACEVARYAL